MKIEKLYIFDPKRINRSTNKNIYKTNLFNISCIHIYAVYVFYEITLFSQFLIIKQHNNQFLRYISYSFLPIFTQLNNNNNNNKNKLRNQVII